MEPPLRHAAVQRDPHRPLENGTELKPVCTLSSCVELCTVDVLYVMVFVHVDGRSEGGRECG